MGVYLRFVIFVVVLSKRQIRWNKINKTDIKFLMADVLIGTYGYKILYP